MSSPVTPEVRKEILASLTKTCVLWTEDLMKGFFDDPQSSFAHQMVLEAYAAAILTLSNRLPNRAAILKTFVIELQDSINKETP